jgi:DnaA-homolog protein
MRRNAAIPPVRVISLTPEGWGCPGQANFTVNDIATLRTAPRMKQLALDLAAPPPPTLDNFVAGRNGELLDQLRRVASGQAGERFFYVWGSPDCGRSHLLRAAIAQLQRAGTGAAYVACGADTRFDAAFQRLNFVALDDVDRLDEEGQVAAFDLYNALREQGGALIASGAAPPVQLELRGDLVTRLAWGLVYQLHALTDEEKTRALAERAASRGFRLPREVADFLLKRVRRDLPSLLAMLDALDRYSLETKRPVTVPLVRELLHAAKPPDPGSRIQDSGGRS